MNQRGVFLGLCLVKLSELSTCRTRRFVTRSRGRLSSRCLIISPSGVRSSDVTNCSPDCDRPLRLYVVANTAIGFPRPCSPRNSVSSGRYAALMVSSLLLLGRRHSMRFSPRPRAIIIPWPQSSRSWPAATPQPNSAVPSLRRSSHQVSGNHPSRTSAQAQLRCKLHLLRTFTANLSVSLCICIYG